MLASLALGLIQLTQPSAKVLHGWPASKAPKVTMFLHQERIHSHRSRRPSAAERFGCPMTVRWLALGIAATITCSGSLSSAQTIDSVITTASRTPISITDEIQDPAERAAFAELMKTTDPQKTIVLARLFLNRFPNSAFLAPVAERAARASFDLSDLQSGLEDARFSLDLLPENPLLLVAVADVEARLQENDAAIGSARDALEDLDRFAGPATIPAREWPNLKRKQQATAWFVIGRATVNEALGGAPEDRQALFEQAARALTKANDLNPKNMEPLYLLGLTHRYANELPSAVLEFSTIYQQGKEFSSEAYEQLEAIYKTTNPGSGNRFNDYLRHLGEKARPVTAPDTGASSTPPMRLGGYAGSAACEHCHDAIYGQWKQSGMSRMLRAYRPENVIGDFTKSNEFYAGDASSFQNGKLEITSQAGRALFARMAIRKGRPFFEIKQSDGSWRSYPVDYTIGSKWQQAYATRLPNGQIHVFPIQYNRIENKWVNYWQVIDALGSERSNPNNWEKLDASTNYMVNCAVCHTSQLRNTRSSGFDQDDLAFREPGVDCEMCHGPSADHIQAMSTGNYAKKDPIDPPVDFRRVSNREFVAICSQCHMQSAEHQGGAGGELNYSSAGTFFLKSVELPFTEFTRGAFYKDGRFKQTTFIVEALERSQCFRKGQVSCGTCHDPHAANEASNPTSLKFQDHPDLMCTGCHTQFQDPTAASAHTHHPYQSEGSRCVSCHMPRIVDALLFGARTHQIDDIPNAQMTLRFGRTESPNACLLCHKEKTAQWVESELQAWTRPVAPQANQY